MAERYKRYESKGLALKMPTVDFTFEKNRSNNLNSLSSNLDRMAQTFYSNAVQTAKIEGAEYGALNAPTEQQLLDASEDNTELDFVGNKDTVFGRYARTATLEATSDRLTVLAKQAMSKITLEGRTNATDPSEIAKELDSVTSGLSDVLDNESPVTSKKFKATLGLYANAEYKTYASKYITDQQLHNKTIWTLEFDNIVNIGLSKLIQAGLVANIPTDITKDGKTVYKDEKVAITPNVINSVKSNLLRKMPPSTTPAEILARSVQFDKAVLQSAKDIVHETVFKGENPYITLSRIENGNLDKLPLAVQSAFSVVAGEDKNLLLKVARDAYDEVEAREMTKISNANTKRAEFIRIAEINASSALLIKDRPDALIKYKAQMFLMERLDPKKHKEMVDVLKENPDLKYATYSDGGTFDKITLKFSALNVDLSQHELNTYLQTGKLNKNDFEDFTTKLSARSDSEFTRALGFARSQLQIPTSFIQMGDRTNENVKVLKTIEEAMYRARRDDKDFKASIWMDNNFQAYRTQGYETEFKAIQQLALDYLNKKHMDNLINRAENGSAYKQTLVDIKSKIEDYNKNPNNVDKVKF
jgi:hypothetical protein